MNILVVSPAYAPYTGVGAARMMSLTKYLVKKGQTVIVLRNNPELWPEHTRKSKVPEGVIVKDVDASGNFKMCMQAYEEMIKEILQQYAIDISIYSCNPYYTAPAAAKMKEMFNAKYILDFRDLWIRDEALTRSILKKIKKYLIRIPYRNLEKKAVETADLVTTVTPRDAACLKGQYRKCSSKIKVVYNGYDETQMNQVLSDNKSFDFPYIAVFGKLGYYDFKYLKEMLLAVKKINSNGKCIKIVHIGDFDKKTKTALNKTKFPENLYINTGFLDYAQGIDLLKKAAMCSLIVHYKRGLGTKIFDYIYVNKPIVYFAQKDSSISDVLSGCTHAYRCENQEDAVWAIQKIMDEEIQKLGCDKPEMYSRKIQNEKFWTYLKNISEEKDEKYEV